MGDNGVTLTNVYNTRSGDFSIKVNDAAIYPLSERATSNPNTLSTGGIYPQGTGWIFEKACMVSYVCKDDKGNTIEEAIQSVAYGSNVTAVAPEITNYEIIEYNGTGNAEAPVFENISENKVVNVTYKRVSNSVTYRCYTVDGNHITDYTVACPIGESHTVACPGVEFYTLVGTDEEQETITPTEDTVIDVYYDTEGIMGVGAIGEAVTELEAGASYVIYNAKDETSRSGFLSVSAVGAGITTTNGISEANPSFVWNFEGDGNKFTVRNNYGIAIPQLLRGSLVTGSETAEQFTFTLNADNTWSVQGTTNSYYWNGNSNNTFTGWDDGHPFIIYSYKPHPYFTVSYKCVDEKGNDLNANNSRYVVGGDSYTLLTPVIEGYKFVKSDAVYEELARVSKNVELTLTYSNNETGIEEIVTENVKDEAIYDMQGRKVTAPAKGIYIINGKKILVK